MRRRPSEPRSASTRLRRGLALLSILPAMLAGPAFAGGAVLLHEHGPDGHHEHRLPAHAHPGHLDALADWHRARHAEHPAHDAPVAPGTVVERPASPVPRPETAGLCLDLAPRLSTRPPAAAVASPPRGAGPPARDADARPRRPGRDSGAARVLRTSRALLI